MDNANTFLHGDFKATMEKLTSALLPSPASLSIVIDSSTDRKNDD